MARGKQTLIQQLFAWHYSDPLHTHRCTSKGRTCCCCCCRSLIWGKESSQKVTARRQDCLRQEDIQVLTAAAYQSPKEGTVVLPALHGWNDRMKTEDCSMSSDRPLTPMVLLQKTTLWVNPLVSWGLLEILFQQEFYNSSTKLNHKRKNWGLKDICLMLWFLQVVCLFVKGQTWKNTNPFFLHSSENTTGRVDDNLEVKLVNQICLRRTKLQGNN